MAGKYLITITTDRDDFGKARKSVLDGKPFDLFHLWEIMPDGIVTQVARGTSEMPVTAIMVMRRALSDYGDVDTWDALEPEDPADVREFLTRFESIGINGYEVTA